MVVMVSVLVTVALLVVMMVMVSVLVAVTILVVMVVMLMLKQLVKLLFNRLCPLHCIKHLLGSKLVPIGAYYSCRGIMLTHKPYSLQKLCLARFLNVAEDYTVSVLYLVVEEFTKILHIHLAFSSINDYSIAVKLYVISFYVVNCLYNVAELSNTRGLDKHSVGRILGNNLFKRIAKVAYKRATDTA